MNCGLIKLGLDALYYSGASSILSPLCQGSGVIFTLHHVRPASARPFQPNAILEVKPEFLDRVLAQVRRTGFDLVSLDEAHRRLTEPGEHAPFAAFTLDDGYRDNRDFAYPVFRQHGCPFTVFVTTGFTERTSELWWVALEEIIRATDRLDVPEKDARYRTGTPGGKHAAFQELYDWLRTVDEMRQREIIRAIAARAGVELADICARLVMDWDELAALAADPLVTIGAHTVNHFALSRIDEATARAEIAGSVARIGERLGSQPEHFAYPYGGEDSARAREFGIAAQLGLKTALTTRKGVLYPDHRSYLTALPRVSLNGDYQSARYVNLFLDGTPFMLWNRFRRLNVA